MSLPNPSTITTTAVISGSVAIIPAPNSQKPNNIHPQSPPQQQNGQKQNNIAQTISPPNCDPPVFLPPPIVPATQALPANKIVSTPNMQTGKMPDNAGYLKLIMYKPKRRDYLVRNTKIVMGRGQEDNDKYFALVF